MAEGETVYTATLKGYDDGLNKELTIPNKVTYNGNEFTVTKIADNAFKNCTKIETVTIENSVASIGYKAFEDCDSLISVTIKDSTTPIENGAFGNCNSLTFITIEHSTTSIGSEAFKDCDNLTSIDIEDSDTSIGTSAFQDCSWLNSVLIKGSNAPISTRAFDNCANLTSVTIQDSISSIGGAAFMGCTKLNSVTLGEGVTSIEANAFNSCVDLTSITIPKSVDSIGSFILRDCTNLTSVTIGEGLKSIANYAFGGCPKLTSITIPSSVNTIGTDLFYDCNLLSTVFYTDKINPTVGQAINKIQYHVIDADASGPLKVMIDTIYGSATNPINEFSCDSMGSGYSIVGLSEELTDKGITLSEHTFSGGWTLYDADPTKHIRTCSGCGLAETQDHDDKGAECVSNNDATCTEDGTETATCSFCNEQYVRTASGSATGHDFNVDLTTRKITCKNTPCDFEANISYDNVNIPTPTVTISSPATVEQNAKATVTVGTSTESKTFTDITVEGSILSGPIVDTSKKVVLTRTTKDLNYKEDGGKPDGVTETKLPTKVPSPTDPEVYTYENFDGEKFTLELTYKEDIHIQDYRITADGAVVNITGEISTDQETHISTVKYEIPLSAGTTNINVECPFDANRDGTFKTGRDYISILNTPWRKE